MENTFKKIVHKINPFSNSTEQHQPILEQIKNWDRYKQEYVEELFHNPIILVDALSFYYSYKEIFEEKIYDFPAKTGSPRIIDCGSNIGLAIIRWKQLYPDSRITGFEADPAIYNVLSKNMSSFKFDNVNLVNKAVWSEETDMKFLAEGADAGRISNLREDTQNNATLSISTDLLSKYLVKQVDFLKIDIEGAELEVMQECRHLLPNVERIFIEYHAFTGKKQQLDKLLNILSENGFRYYLKTQYCPAKPFYEITNRYNMDLQLNISAIKQV